MGTRLIAAFLKQLGETLDEVEKGLVCCSSPEIVAKATGELAIARTYVTVIKELNDANEA